MMPLVVRDIVRETPAIVSLRLEDPEGAELPPWDPGAHLDLQLITRHERQYSLCGDPEDRTGYRIAVLREEFSRGGSAYVHDFLRVGARVHARPPRNLFAVEPAASYLLLAAGIGITPILAMARHLAATGAEWRMVYLVRSREDVAFVAEVEALGGEVHVSSEVGRLDVDELVSGLGSEAAVYACGPAALTDALLAVVTAASVHLERFEPKQRVTRPNEPFTVVAARTGVTVEVPVDRTMLQALNGAGVDVPGSCLRGICGSCALTVLDGVPEHRDSLNPDDDSTTIYPCVSRAISPVLTLDA